MSVRRVYEIHTWYDAWYTFPGTLLLLLVQVIGFQLEDTMPDVMMRESLMTAAFSGEPLGRPYWCPPAAVPRLAASMVQGFRRR